MAFQFIKSKAEGSKNDPVILSSEIIFKSESLMQAEEAMYYESAWAKKSGEEYIEEPTERRAMIVDGSDRVKFVFDIVEM